MNLRKQIDELVREIRIWKQIEREKHDMKMLEEANNIPPKPIEISEINFDWMGNATVTTGNFFELKCPMHGHFWGSHIGAHCQKCAQELWNEQREMYK